MEGSQDETTAAGIHSKKSNVWGILIPIGCSLPPIDLKAEDYTIGRMDWLEENDVSLSQPNVRAEIWASLSAHHFRITRVHMSSTQKVVMIQDLSENGTYVNRLRIEFSPLKNGDIISLSAPEYEMFKFFNSELQTRSLISEELRETYYYDSLIGKGAFGDVSLIIDKSTMEKFALKTIGTYGEEGVLNEIYILKQLSHPCIVQFIDVTRNDEAVFLLMEYMPNGTLHQYLRDNGGMAESGCKLALFQLAWAVDYLHGIRVTHRDIKPENILMGQYGDIFLAKLGDFGLSKICENMLIELKTQCGTWEYMAPEVHLGKPYSSKIDIWSLGAVLYTCLAGRRPFGKKRQDPDSLIEKITNGEFDTAGPRWYGITTGAKTVVNSCLAVDPNSRLDSNGLLKHRWFEDKHLQRELQLLFGPAAPEVLPADDSGSLSAPPSDGEGSSETVDLLPPPELQSSLGMTEIELPYDRIETEMEVPHDDDIIEATGSSEPESVSSASSDENDPPRKKTKLSPEDI